MAFVNIGIKGLKEAQSFISKQESGIRKEVKAEMKFAGEEIVALIKRDAPVDRARLKNSVSVKMGAGLSMEIVAQNSYAPFMEFGTKSKFKAPNGLDGYTSQFRGQKGTGENPIVALEKWVRRKGLADTYSIKKYDIATRSGVRRSRGKAYKKREKTIAFLIFRKIRKEGVNPHPFFFSNDAGVNRIKQAEDIIVKRLTTALKNIRNA